MPDADKELKIRITTAADTSGLKQTAEALKEVSDAAKKSHFLHAENAPGAGPTPPDAGDAPIAGANPPLAPSRVDNALASVLGSIAEAARLLLIAAGALDARASDLRLSPGAPQPTLAPADTFAAPASSAGTGAEGKSAPPDVEAPDSASTGPASASLQLARNISGDQSSLLNSLTSLLQLNRDSLGDTLDLVRRGLQDQAALRDEIAALKRSVAQLAAGRANPGMPTPP